MKPIFDFFRRLWQTPRDWLATHRAARNLVRAALILLLSLGIVYAVQLITLESVTGALAWVFRHPGPVLLTALLLAAAIVVLYCLTTSLFAGALLVLLPCVLLAFVNYFKTIITGAVLEIDDLMLAGNLGQITGYVSNVLHLSRCGWLAIAGCVLLLLITFWLARPLRLRWRARAVAGATALLVLLGVGLGGFSQRALLDRFGLHTGQRIGQSYSNSVHGLLAGLYRSWVLSRGEKPAGYDEAYMQDLLAGISAAAVPSGSDGVTPNVVLVLSESFFDVTDLPNVTLGGDPLPNFHALEQQTLSGTFYSTFCGYGTGNVERVLLTGLHSRYFPYGTNLCFLDADKTASLAALPEVFRRNGYDTLALHTYSSELYNRAVSFPALGFDTVLFEDSFYDASRVAGDFLSDDYFADLLIQNYEALTADGSNAFLYGISMENHQTYYADKYDSYDFSVASDRLNETELGALSAIVQGIHDADAALGKLVDYFSTCEEPVMLVWFGDHRPSTPTADGSSLYVKLGLCPTTDEADWSLEQSQTLHSTDYLIWTNYELFDAETVAANVLASDLTLGCDLLDWSGVQKTLFWQLADQSADRLLGFSQYFFVDGDGVFYPKAEGVYADAISTYEDIVYDVYYGKGYATEALNRLY